MTTDRFVGLAAYNINGKTTHKTFLLPIDTSQGAGGYAPLKRDELMHLRESLKHTLLFIVDEVSMVCFHSYSILSPCMSQVSNTWMLNIHKRLDECFPNDTSPFGDRDMAVLGDMLQLKPVKANFIFEPLSTKQTGAVVCHDAQLVQLWRGVFSYRELTVNMRHGDPTWSNLNSNARVGRITDEENELLNSRVIKHLDGDGADAETSTQRACRKYMELLGEGQKPLIICSLKEQTDDINQTLLKKLCNNPVQFDAVDSANSAGVSKDITDADAGGLRKNLVSWDYSKLLKYSHVDIGRWRPSDADSELVPNRRQRPCQWSSRLHNSSGQF